MDHWGGRSSERAAGWQVSAVRVGGHVSIYMHAWVAWLDRLPGELQQQPVPAGAAATHSFRML